MSQPVIRKFLDLSTAHLPEDLRHGEGWGGAVVVETGYGFLLWVPDDPQDSAEGAPAGIPAEVLAVQLYARKHDCDYVLFDADGEENDDLPTFEG